MDATNHSFKLSVEDFEYLTKIEHSINHWSKELGLASLRVRGMEDQLAGVYESREQFMRQTIEKAGFKADKAVNIKILADGEVQFVAVPEEVMAKNE
jgi:hypothetical protein